MTEKQVQEWLEGDTKHRTGKHESKMSHELNPVVRRTHDKVVSSMNPVKKATESILKMQLEIEKAGKELAWMKRRSGRMQTGSPTKDDPDPSKYPEVYHQREEMKKQQYHPDEQDGLDNPEGAAVTNKFKHPTAAKMPAYPGRKYGDQTLEKGDWSENESGRGRLRNPRTDAKPDEEIKEKGRVTVYNKPGASHNITVEKGDEMEEVEKDMKGPESPGVKKPGKIPLSANKQAITEEPATVSSTSQNYKQTPDMNKGDDVDKAYSKAGQTQEKWNKMRRQFAPGEKHYTPKKNEPISKSDEVALKKAVSDATTLMKAMKISVERL